MMAPAVKIGCVTCGTRLHVLAGPLNRLDNCVLAPPSAPLRLNCGKYAARATPICALDAARLLLGSAHVGPSFQQRRRQAGGDVRRKALFRQTESTVYNSGIVAEQEFDLVLGLLDLLLDHRDGLRGGVYELFRLTKVELCGDAAGLPGLGEHQGLLAGLQGSPRYLQRVIQLAQAQVRGRHIAHQRRHDRLAIFLRP
ncbi:MAG: hypothetical protein WDO73_16840 [Ignavibacteriota bacterium]